MAKATSREGRARRQRGIRAKISGTSARPRLNVFRSNAHIYAQIIDDVMGHTLVAASTVDPSIKPNMKDVTKLDEAKQVGKLVAERALAKGISTVVFDRGGFRYHGRVQALADAAREAGLKF
ncbi:MAG: 50S ribosomal protein L18 [Herpetosiphonaceae bacterium]|nr:50S ribosomal protein L18 [Herpetosiphonaceae bacterium]